MSAVPDREHRRASTPVPDRTTPSGQPLVAGLLLATLGFQSTSALPSTTALASSRTIESTTAGRTVPARRSGAAIGELKRLSGLTWAQLAELFGRSRRALHFWASGAPMSADSEAALARVLGVIRRTDRGSASANRRSLFAPARGGDVPFDLLRDGEYDRATEALGVSDVARPRPRPPAAETIASRRPRPPAELVDALQDPVEVPEGRLLGAVSLTDRRKP